jgi:hypothetical protein
MEDFDYDKKLKFLIKNREYLYIIAENEGEMETNFDDFSNHYRVYFSGDVAIFEGKSYENEFFSRFRISNIIPISKKDKCYNLFLCSTFNHYHTDLIKDKFKTLTGKKVKWMELRFNYKPYTDHVDWFKDNFRTKYYEIDHTFKNKNYEKLILFVPVLRQDIQKTLKAKYKSLKNDKKNLIKVFWMKNDENIFNI